MSARCDVPSEDLFAEDVGVSAVMGEFAEDMKVNPTQGQWAASVSLDYVVESHRGRGRYRGRTG